MKKLKVVLALITKENDYQREQAAVGEATARRLGIELRLIYADNNAIAQTQQLFAALRAGPADRPDAIIVEPVGTSMSQVAKTAVASGVGWVVMNRDAEELAELRSTSSVPVGRVLTDNVEVGRIQGRQFAALLPSGGAVLYIEGPATDVSKQRRAGVQETLPANIKLQTVRGNWTEESARQTVSALLQPQWALTPTVGIIGCQNDAMAMGARKAMEALAAAQRRELWLKVPLTGCDGVPTSGQVWVRRGLLAATVVTPPLSGVALEQLARAVTAGTQMPDRTVTKPSSFPPVESLGPRPSAQPGAPV
jgi:ABC-type sugar transport system substrate-binding protein